ncbi:MAG: hypothetical protein K2M36_03475, partial [Clostridia bacterium]|nr:hypothetical protein [Clostridia bacterium]
PVYSTLPRPAEEVSGMKVRHVGGEDNDILLDTVYYFGKRLVFFYTASAQYDVKEAGVHVAVFVGDALTSTVKIGEANEEFVTSSTVMNGLLVITKNAGGTILRLFDDDLALSAKSTCAAYSSYKLFITGSATRLYASDARYIYSLSISPSLEVIRSNFVYPLDGATVVEAMTLGSESAVFAQSEQGVGVLTFSAITGFAYKCELTNCRFVQLLPIVANNKQAVAILSKTDKGMRISSVSDNLTVSESYDIDGADSAVALRQANGNIHVIADKKLYTFCSHLELQTVKDVSIDSNILSALGISEPEQPSTLSSADKVEFTYSAIDGKSDLLIMSKGTTNCIVSVSDGALTLRFSAVCNKLITVDEPYSAGVSKLSVMLSGTSANAFAYMCFGKNDVFYVTLP